MSRTEAEADTRRAPERATRLTERRALSLPPPPAGYSIHWCPQTRGFGVRVTSAGARSWVSERRVDGKTVRRTLGKVEGRSAISADTARRLMLDVSSELQRGIDRMQERRAERQEARAAEAEAVLTLSAALAQYVNGKRRAKDALPLKERTRNDYLAMVAEGGSSKSGRPYANGELFALADVPISKITADNVRAVFKSAAARGTRRGTYAMQVLRAVLNWHGVKVPGNPLGKEIAGKERIVLAKSAGAPKPIPPEKLAAWWQAATAMRGREAADFYRVMLLSGARGIEVKGLTVRDVDIDGARVLLRDTKNRTDHTVLMSRQLADIIARYVSGKKAGAKVFGIADPRKALVTINATAGTSVTPHNLRATFASVAEELVSAYTLKRMVNHAESDDVTGSHYIGKSESQLRAGWQAVADFIAGPF